MKKEALSMPLNPDRLHAEIEVLRAYISDRRWERMQTVLDQRTRYITAVVEDIYQPHNGSAVLRSCDAFGIQDVHIIENRNRYQINPGVELGTSQWLTMHRYTRPNSGDPTEATRACIASLRAAGYRIVATTPHRDDVTPDELPMESGPVALLFGTEKEGLTDTALAAADEYLRIPMVGFVESLNISVSAAITLHSLGKRLRQHRTDAGVIPWQLPPQEREAILHGWLRHSVRHAERIIERRLGG